MSADIKDYRVDLPSGGALHLQTADEVDLWNKALERYHDDYIFAKHNDLVTLGALLQQQIVLFRAQTAINGMTPELDQHGVPTGSYKRVEMDGADLAAYQRVLTETAKEVRALEKSLGIDKVSRESGGAHTVDSYVKNLKKAAHDRGIHIVERTLALEAFRNELSWKLRLLFNADAEDRAYHNITPKTVLEWAYSEMDKLDQIDKDFAHQKGKLYVGAL